MENIRKRHRAVQTNVEIAYKSSYCDKSCQTQQVDSVGSYSRKDDVLTDSFTTFRYLIINIINTKTGCINWCMQKKVISSERYCSMCSSKMKLCETIKTSDGLRWRCQKFSHNQEESIRKNSWLEQSNLTIEEVIELTYWWSTGTKK